MGATYGNLSRRHLLNVTEARRTWVDQEACIPHQDYQSTTCPSIPAGLAQWKQRRLVTRRSGFNPQFCNPENLGGIVKISWNLIDITPTYY
jgi:hypothetical protein